MFKSFKPGDIQYTETLVHKSITLTDESDSITTVAFNSDSDNRTDPNSYFHSIYQLFYRPNVTKYFTYDEKGYVPNTPIGYLYSGTGSYYSHTDGRCIGSNKQPQHKNKFNKEGVLFTLSSSIYGHYIKPGTFELTDYSNAHTLNVKDDGYGNLYVVPSSGIISSSGTTSISSSENYIGNIFYEHGIAVVSETGSFNNSGSGQFYISGGVNYSMSFDSTMEINTMEYICKLLPHEYNWSTNPTILSASDAIATSSFYINNDMTRPEISASAEEINLSKHVRHVSRVFP